MKCLLTVFGCLITVLSGCGGNGQKPVSVQDMPVLPVDTLQAVLEIGVELGDSTNTFGAIISTVIDRRGRILVLDQVASCMKVYDSNGNYLRQISRHGNGPGELVMPWGMFLMSDGRLMVLDPGKKGFVVFDDSLQFVEEIGLWPQNPPFQGTPLSENRYVGYKIGTDMTDGGIVMNRRVALYTYGEEEWDLILWQDSIEASMNEIMENPSMFLIDMLDPLSIGGNGSDRIYFSLKDGEEYRITGWNPEGEEILSISMDLAPVEKTPAEIAAESTYVTNYISRMSGGGGFPFEFEPDPFKDMVIGVNIGPDGNLWVRRGTVNTPFFDIFDTNGNLLHHTIFPCDGWSWKTSVSQEGILAWEEDPEEGYQVLYLLE
ncbi:MAG: 6-bladed beta-propeller [Candidatus Aegiribacteria sp.]|nr:6-bladed beta-propeller [Candidatus Aegiribacteria sp.]